MILLLLLLFLWENVLLVHIYRRWRGAFVFRGGGGGVRHVFCVVEVAGGCWGVLTRLR